MMAMMILNIILIVLVLFLAFFIFYKLLKTFFRAMFAVVLLIIFVVAVFGAVIYIDINKIKGNLDEDKTILLSHEGTVVAGFIYSGNKDSEVLEVTNIELLTESRISEINEEISNDEYGEDSEGLITLIVDSSSFQDKTVEISEGTSINVSGDLISSVFSCKKLSECTAPLISAAPGLKKEISSSFDDEQDVKNKLFFNLFVKEVKDSKGAFIFDGIKDEKMTVYPELTTIKLIKILPDKLLDRLIKKRIVSDENSDSETEE